ncbi:tetraacyldisaccharide 4'-kinase [Leeuwenhoekiella sp. A16]|uniref:tetraacyldisaccharide 4'-kinase n=1 Tax=unclassified Leeuwenhoekiella TaxID=2615029 RepID=UPI003A8025B1
MNNLRKLLFPFALIYQAITGVRNYLFNKGWLVSRVYDFPLIGIGNLSVGGTGKSPMTEYVLRLLGDNYKVATLSRGYGRKTKGYLDVTPDSAVHRTGDEPLQFAKKFKEVYVAVDEDRRNGISLLRNKNPKPEIIVLDDVYQHRKVKPGFIIMLSAYDSMFYGDFILPAGNLRESRKGAKRADCIIVTKCPSTLNEVEKGEIGTKIRKYSSAPVYFSTIAYGVKLHGASSIDLNELPSSFTLVTGIANPAPLLNYLDENMLRYEHVEFSDHHNFTEKEINELDKREVILTTEKDYMRLEGKFKHATLYYLPIEMRFLEEKDRFSAQIRGFLNEFSK